MTTPRRALTVFPTLAALGAEPGPRFSFYAFCVENGRTYEWVPDDATTANGSTVLSSSGGTPGRWLMRRAPQRGADLTDANATIAVADGLERRIPAGTLGDNRTLTIDDAGAAEGDVWTLTRLDVGAYTIALVNGGVAGGTIATLPVSARAFADLTFDGTNWALLRAATMP